MTRKFFSAILVGALLLTTVPALANENTGDTPLPFTDVASGEWYYDAVKYAYAQGLMTGTSDTSFEPNTTMTRGMIVSVLYRREGNPDISNEILGYPYEDVLTSDWFSTPVYWARLHGIVTGYSAEQFGPNDPITREQLAAILYNYADYKGWDVSATTDLSRYSDAASISDWATTVLSWANAEGLINGMTETTIDPQAGATRAQVAAIMQRFLGESDTPDEPQGETVTLRIGLPDNLKDVTATVDEVTPENLLAALAEETGWNLDLAGDVTTRDVSGHTVANIAFADDSGLYTEPPQDQKDDYHVYDREQWIYTLLNSVAETFNANGYDGVSFTAPDGGKLVMDDFTLMPTFIWNYDAAYDSNHPSATALQEYFLSPSKDSLNALGNDSVSIYLPVDAVEITGGTMTVYNQDGEAIETVQLKDAAFISDAMDNTLQDGFAMNYNWETVTAVNIALDRSLLTAGTYSIHLDAGSIKADDGRLSPEITTDEWRFTIADFGVGSATLPGDEPSHLTLGTTYTADFVLDGEDADRVVIHPVEGFISADITTLTQSGTVTFTPQASTDGENTILWQADFYKGDTFVYSMIYTGVIG